MERKQMPSSRPVEILLVEDSDADIRLTQEGLRETKIRNNLHIAKDGFEAMDFLHRRDGHAHAPTPDVILLDLNMPGKDGREVLAEIKSDESLKTIPVVILTTSQEEQDVTKSYASHANCYVRKPIGIEGYFDVVKSIEGFWFEIVTLPPKS